VTDFQPHSISPPFAPQGALPRTNRRFAVARTVFALILREMSTRYGRTPGGYLWGVIEPLAAIVLLSFGFSLMMRSPGLGTSFLLFYATGYLPFNLYMVLSGTVSQSISFSKALLKYPAVTWVDAVLARFILNSLTGILIMVLLSGGIMIAQKSQNVLDFPTILVSILLAMLLGIGIGVLNCALFGLFPVWRITWSILTRPLFLASGIFFMYESAPPVAQQFLWYNPLLHVVGLMRAGFYSSYQAEYVSIVYVSGVGAVLLALGVILLGRHHRDILNA
jgi:capsular polysaccharide transport system permease protein